MYEMWNGMLKSLKYRCFIDNRLNGWRRRRRKAKVRSDFLRVRQIHSACILNYCSEKSLREVAKNKTKGRGLYSSLFPYIVIYKNIATGKSLQAITSLDYFN